MTSGPTLSTDHQATSLPTPMAHFARAPGRIQLLSMTVAERIAAGEVVERPASVVKELLENSIDAGATEISIRLEQGGKSLIEILDNGCGMDPSDLELCIERHATSKLSTLEDLDSILTLGFRGEALASVSAVTDLQIVSRAQGSDSTYQLQVGDLAGRVIHKPKAEKITFGHFNHSNHGTRIQARGLFSQVPARLKFLKAQGTEVSQIREWVERLAIAHPKIGFQLISDDRTLLRLAPAANASGETDRIRTILADGEDYPVLTATNEQDGVRDLGLKIRLHWLQGLSSPQNRKLVQIVNGRAVRDRMLQQAVLAPFRQLLLPGQFPAVALVIEIQPAAIDVNVHPTKTEIRFLDSRKIFSTIDSLVKSLVSREGAPAIPHSFGKPMNHWNAAEPFRFSPEFPAASAPTFPPTFPSAFSPPFLPPTEPGDSPTFAPSFPVQTELPTPQSPAMELPRTKISQSRYIGTLFQTYLVFESHEQREMILVDQHAAHERIRYEKLRQRILGAPTAPHTFSSQALLLPEVVRFPEEHAAHVKKHLEWLTAVGFETEFFGEDTLVFRSLPIEWGTKQLKVRLRNLIDRIIATTQPDSSLLLDESLFEALANEACHSAVRAGDSLEDVESETLMRQLFECEQPWNCPHGRPTVVKVTQGKLEEWFQRKV